MKRKDLRVKIKEAFQQGHEKGLSESFSKITFLKNKIALLQKRIDNFQSMIDVLKKENETQSKIENLKQENGKLKTQIEEEEK